jgi:hypothetical protein
MLEGIFKGLIQWLHGMALEIIEYIANGLLDVFSMDLSYFERVIPVTKDIIGIITAIGWALLLGNLVFQAAKSMMSGLGFEGDSARLKTALSPSPACTADKTTANSGKGFSSFPFPL